MGRYHWLINRSYVTLGRSYKLNPLLIVAEMCLTFELLKDSIWFIQKVEVRKYQTTCNSFVLKIFKGASQKTEIGTVSCTKGGIQSRHQDHQGPWDPTHARDKIFIENFHYLLVQQALKSPSLVLTGSSGDLIWPSMTPVTKWNLTKVNHDPFAFQACNLVHESRKQ